MGCWNSTCALSNLPIMDGEKVKVVILFKGHNPKLKSGSCHIDDVLCPIFLPLTGEYNDYGSVDFLEEDLNHSLVTKLLKNVLGPELILDREVLKPEINKDWTIEDFLSGIERGVVKHRTRKLSDRTFYFDEKNEILTEDWSESDFSFVMIREDVYNFFVEQSKLTKNFWGGLRIDKFQEDVQKNISYLDSEDWKIQMKFDLLDMRLCRLVGFTIYSNFIRESREHRKEVFDMWVEFSLVSALMEDLRLTWLPSSGQGSQDTDWETHKKFSEKRIEICNNKIKEQEEW